MVFRRKKLESKKLLISGLFWSKMKRQNMHLERKRKVCLIKVALLFSEGVRKKELRANLYFVGGNNSGPNHAHKVNTSEKNINQFLFICATHQMLYVMYLSGHKDPKSSFVKGAKSSLQVQFNHDNFMVWWLGIKYWRAFCKM